MTEKLDYAKDRILNQGTKNDHLILGAIWPYLQEKKKLVLYLTIYSQINSTWIKAKTIFKKTKLKKLENIRERKKSMILR